MGRPKKTIFASPAQERRANIRRIESSIRYHRKQGNDKKVQDFLEELKRYKNASKTQNVIPLPTPAPNIEPLIRPTEVTPEASISDISTFLATNAPEVQEYTRVDVQATPEQTPQTLVNPTPQPSMPNLHKVQATMCVSIADGLTIGLLGEDMGFKPAERSLLQEATASYFEATGVQDFPPGMALVMCVAGVYASRVPRIIEKLTPNKIESEQLENNFMPTVSTPPQKTEEPKQRMGVSLNTAFTSKGLR